MEYLITLWKNAKTEADMDCLINEIVKLEVNQELVDTLETFMYDGEMDLTLSDYFGNNEKLLTHIKPDYKKLLEQQEIERVEYTKEVYKLKTNYKVGDDIVLIDDYNFTDGTATPANKCSLKKGDSVKLVAIVDNGFNEGGEILMCKHKNYDFELPFMHYMLDANLKEKEKVLSKKYNRDF